MDPVANQEVKSIMKFIMLTKSIEGKQVAVNVNSIVSVEIHDEESTWVELSSGAKFLVIDFADDILAAIKAEVVCLKIPGSEKQDMDPITAEKKVSMMRLVDEFKDFVSDSIDEGMHEDFDDHMVFLEACMGTFIEMKRGESE